MVLNAEPLFLNSLKGDHGQTLKIPTAPDHRVRLMVSLS